MNNFEKIKNMTNYRNGATFYKSYYDTFKAIKTNKEKIFYIDSLLKLLLYGEIISNDKKENLKEFDDYANEILDYLDKNKMFFAKISLIKSLPHLRKCYQGYLNWYFRKRN